MLLRLCFGGLFVRGNGDSGELLLLVAEDIRTLLAFDTGRGDKNESAGLGAFGGFFRDHAIWGFMYLLPLWVQSL